MCLIAFAYQVHPEFPLVVIANRDEFWARPTAPLHHWSDAPILAGRDKQAGGTWMGVNRAGGFAAVTNYREVPAPRGDFLSRGALVSSFLQQDRSCAEMYCQGIAAEGEQYPGFNLLCNDGEQMWVLSNRSEHGPQKLKPGVYGLSNHLLDTPWPKLCKVRDGLAQALDRQEDLGSLEALMMLMLDKQQAEDTQLPDTGVGLERERWLSSAFIESETYGTRSTTGVCIDQNGLAKVLEWQHAPEQQRASLVEALNR